MLAALICGGPDEYHEYLPSILPLLEWCSIPAGIVDIVYASGNGQQTVMEVKVSPFRMARYPVTNAQYQSFIDS